MLKGTKRAWNDAGQKHFLDSISFDLSRIKVLG